MRRERERKWKEILQKGEMNKRHDKVTSLTTFIQKKKLYNP